MIKIRLARKGKKNAPFYKIVAIESQRKIGGKYLDSLGFYDPSKDEFVINKEKLDKWVEKGAQVSEAVKKLINRK